MARSPLDKRNVRKLFQTGGTTYAVTLPIEYIRALGWQDDQQVTIRHDDKNNRLIIEDWNE